jgi:RimJ/RimL family protein N-acetyltransferase
MTLITPRMRLVPTTARLVRAEIEDRIAFAALLGATVPESWPPEMLADALPWFLRQLEEHSDWSGWLSWYGIVIDPSPQPPILVGSAGFTGPPRDGAAEVGYSVLPEHQRRGYASEMVRALIDWAFARPGVQRLIANTTTDNVPSIRLLCRVGFEEAAEGLDPLRGYPPNSIRFEHHKPGE